MCYVRGRLASVALLVLIALSTISLPSSAQQPSSITLTGWILVPAVEGGGGGSLINVTITIKVPGSGSIRVLSERGERGVGETTKSSMVMAVKTGSLYAGYYWGGLDATIVIGTREDVEGPSGGFAVALLTYLLLTHNTNMSLKGYVVTGAISPDGLSSRVGGVSVKCSVAQRAGYTLLIPLANKPDVGPACRAAIPTAGLLSALSTLKGLPALALNVSYPLPEEYNRGMRGVAQDMIRASEEIARRLSGAQLPWSIEGVSGNISRARELLENHPYAAASFAFVAYLTAIQSDYYVNLSRRGLEWASGELSRLRVELESLKREMDSMPRSGSIFYVEFLATAYTRLADANTTLMYAESATRGGGSQADIAYYLGFARARLESVKAWISIAKLLEGKSPVIGEDVVRSIALAFGDYVRTSVDYASNLVKYIIEVYSIPQEEKDQLVVYLRAVEGLVARGDRELAEGNYLAALGFYREAFSKSLARLFTPPSVMTGDIAEGYMWELSSLQAILASTIISRGLVSGLAPAYADYAMVRYRLGDYNAAVDLMEEAVASTILWYVATLRTPQPGGMLTQIIPVQQQAQTRGGSLMDFYVAASLVVLLSFLLGVTLSSWLSYRSLRSS